MSLFDRLPRPVRSPRDTDTAADAAPPIPQNGHVSYDTHD